jgi:putative ABC transport system permease protein
MSLRRTLIKLRALFRPETSDLPEEIQSHIAMEEADNLARGMPPEDARFAARQRFGNVTLTQERTRDMWTWSNLETLKMDALYGLRQLRRNPGFAIVAILTLALGIGVNTAIFSVVNAVLLEPLPFDAPDRLVSGFETEAAPGNYPVNQADYLDWQRRNHTFDFTSGYSWTRPYSIAGEGEAAAAAGTEVQANFFQTLGIQPMLGRGFVHGEDSAGSNRVGVLSFGFWKSQFAGDPNILGKALTLDADRYTVIGVMPPTFHYPAGSDVWIPFNLQDPRFSQRGNHGIRVLGRMKSGVTLAQARQDLLHISLQIEKQYPDQNKNVHAVLIPLKQQLVGDSEQRLVVLLCAVGLVLLIACVNIANLLLARAAGRQREIALRVSLGAGRFRLIRQLITESFVLSLIGALLGSIGAWWLLRLLDKMTTSFVPRLNPLGIDAPVLLFTLFLSIVSAVLFGLAPALRISRAHINDSMKASAQAVGGAAAAGRQTLRDILVLGEIAITLALLVGAGLLLRSFVKLETADIGIDPNNLLTVNINLPNSSYPNLAERRRFFDALEKRAQQMPGVKHAAISVEIPLEGGNNGYVTIDGNKDAALANSLLGFNYVTPSYFETFGIRLLGGRWLTGSDYEHDGIAAQKAFQFWQAAGNQTPKMPPDVAFHTVISQSAARVFWKKQAPIGSTFHYGGVPVVVVGIVEDVKEYGLRQDALPQAYYPFSIAQAYGGGSTLTLRTSVSSASVIAELRRTIHNLDRGLALLHPRSMQDVIADQTEDTRMQTLLLGSFAALALILSAVGLYGVMSYTVTQRTREIGIRMAVGASANDVLRMILLHGLRITMGGIVFGLLLSFALSRSLTSLLFGISPFDPAVFAAVATLMVVVATLSYLLPARRATVIDPTQALRAD